MNNSSAGVGFDHKFLFALIHYIYFRIKAEVITKKGKYLAVA
jgi:hypothetical protein